MRRFIISIFILSIAFLGVIASCTDDYIKEEKPIPVNRQLELDLRISIPNVEAAPQSRALAPEDERSVDPKAFHVILFRENPKNPDTFIFSDTSHWITPENIEWKNSSTADGHAVKSLRILLPDSLRNVRMMAMIFANYYVFKFTVAPTESNKYPDAKTMAALKKESLSKNINDFLLLSEIRSQIWPSGDGTVPAFKLPMWGIISRPFTAGTADIGTVTLLRALARVDVGVNITSKVGGTYNLDNMKGNPPEGDETFELVEVGIYKAGAAIRMNPILTKYNPETGNVTGPSVYPPGNNFRRQTITQWYKNHTPDPYMITREIYIPEVGNKVDNKNACRLVIGGKYNGGKTTYYRVDLYDRVEKKPDGTQLLVKPSAKNRYDLLRNYAYVVNILRVRGPGYASPDIAAESDPINIEVEIKDWDEGQGMTEVTTDGQYRLATSVGSLNYHADGGRQPISVFTDFEIPNRPQDTGWNLAWEGMENDATNPLVFYDAAGNQIPRNEWAVKVIHGNANHRSTLNIGMKPFDASTSGGAFQREVKLTFTAGRMRLDVLLTQDTKNVTSLKLLPNVLSFNSEAKTSQGLIMQLSPPGNIELWAHWQDKNSIDQKYCFSDPVAHASDNSPIPAMFASGDGGKFFEASAQNIYLLQPTKWDAAHNGGVPPTETRSMKFRVEAKWSNGPTYSDTLLVKQAHVVINWSVLDREGGALLPDTTLYFPNDGGASDLTRSAWIQTGADLNWYFSNYTETGNSSGEKWLTNWDEVSMQKTGFALLAFKIMPNPGLQERRMTIQANSPEDGFNKSTSYIRLVQAAGNVHFRLLPGLGTEVADLTYDEINRKYTLNLGANALSGEKRLSVLANTNYWWKWARDGVSSGEGFRLNPDNSLWDRILLARFSAIPEEGEANATTNNVNAVDYTWSDVFLFRWPRGNGVFPTGEATSDESLIGLPKAGNYSAGIVLENKHTQLTPGQVADNILRLDIVRSMPSSVYIEWPLPAYANLGNYTDGATKSLKLGTNNRLHYELQELRGDTWVKVGSSEGDFTVGSVYQTFTIANVLAPLYPGGNVPSFNADFKIYRLLVSGPRQEIDGQPDNPDWSISRIYYTGTRIVRPVLVNSDNPLLSNVRQAVVLDYSSSSFEKLEVRVRETDVDFVTGNRLATGARPDRVTYYRLESKKLQRYLIHYMGAHNDETDEARKCMIKLTVEYWDTRIGQWKEHEQDGKGRDWFVAQDASEYTNKIIFYPELMPMPDAPASKITENPIEYVRNNLPPGSKDFTGTSYTHIFRGADNWITRFTLDGDADRKSYELYWRKIYSGHEKELLANYNATYDIGPKGGTPTRQVGYSLLTNAEPSLALSFYAGKKVEGSGNEWYFPEYTFEYIYRNASGGNGTRVKAIGVRKVFTKVAGTDISAWSPFKAEKLEVNPH